MKTFKSTDGIQNICLAELIGGYTEGKSQILLAEPLRHRSHEFLHVFGVALARNSGRSLDAW